MIDNPGQNDQKSGDQAKPDDGQKDETPKAPSVTMKESSMDKPNENDEEKKDEAASKPSAGKLSLPSLTLADPNPKQGSSCPAGKKMDEAVDAQEELLAEFQAVAEELQKLISNLEGTTFVKRLKALARREVVLAKDIDGSTLSAFGESNNVVKDATSKRTELLAERQRAHGQTLQHIEDDLVAYSNRVEDAKFKIVLNEMRDMEAVKQVRVVADRMVANEPGTSIAHSELLADTFDRWAEQLVSTAPGGS